MSPDMRHSPKPSSSQRGMSLVELVIVITILGTVLAIVTKVLLSTSRVESRTMNRAEVQGDARQALMLFSNEIRQAGTDPGDPPLGTLGVISGDSVTVRVRADLNGDRVIQTTEPSEDVTYRYDAGQQALTRDPGTGAVVVLSNVTAMSFSFFDLSNTPVTPLPLNGASAATVQSVGLSMTCQNRDSEPLTLASRITLRNQ